MAISKGKLLLVNKNGTAIAGDSEATVTEEGGLIEYKTKSMNGTGREYDGKDLTISGSALVDLTDGSLGALQTAKEGETKLTDITVVTALGTYSGTFLIESFEITGADGDMQSASYTLKSDNGYTFTGA
jgi:hypothetical protein